MDDQRVGAAFRAVRVRRGLTQAQLAAAAGVSQALVSRVERGHLGSVSVSTLRRLAAALDIRIDISPRWRAGELDRLLSARHSAMHETIATLFRRRDAWATAPEVSFAVYGERGVIDLLCWHAGRRAVLVIELKTELIDIQDEIGVLDRKRRLADRIARERGWVAETVSCWLVLAESRTNRRRVAAHRNLLRAAFPQDGRTVRRWLSDPAQPLAALSFLTTSHPRTTKPSLSGVQRVRRPRVRPG